MKAAPFLLLCLSAVASHATASPFHGEVERERIRVEQLFAATDDLAAIEARFGQAEGRIETTLPIPSLPGEWCGTRQYSIQVYAYRYSRLSEQVDVDVIIAENSSVMALAITEKVAMPPPEPAQPRRLPALLLPESGCVGRIL